MLTVKVRKLLLADVLEVFDPPRGTGDNVDVSVAVYVAGLHAGIRAWCRRDEVSLHECAAGDLVEPTEADGVWT